MKLSERQKQVISIMQVRGYLIRWNGMRSRWEYIKDSNVIIGAYLGTTTAQSLVSKVELIELRFTAGYHKVYQLTELGKTIEL